MSPELCSTSVIAFTIPPSDVLGFVPLMKTLHSRFFCSAPLFGGY